MCEECVANRERLLRREIEAEKEKNEKLSRALAAKTEAGTNTSARKYIVFAYAWQKGADRSVFGSACGHSLHLRMIDINYFIATEITPDCKDELPCGWTKGTYHVSVVLVDEATWNVVKASKYGIRDRTGEFTKHAERLEEGGEFIATPDEPQKGIVKEDVA